MWRAWAPRHPELLGSTGTGLGERRLITIWTSCPLPSCQKAQTFGSPAISLGCLPTPECLNFLRALSFAARDWHRSCKGNGWFSHWPAFGICTLTFMQERIWRLKMCFWTQGYISRSNRRRNTLQRNVFFFWEGMATCSWGPWQEQSDFFSEDCAVNLLCNLWKIPHTFLVFSPCPYNGDKNTSNLMKVSQIAI